MFDQIRECYWNWRCNVNAGALKRNSELQSLLDSSDLLDAETEELLQAHRERFWVRLSVAVERRNAIRYERLVREAGAD